MQVARTLTDIDDLKHAVGISDIAGMYFKGLHIPSIQFVGVAPQANTVLKNWLENEKQEVPNLCASQQCPRMLLTCLRASISGQNPSRHDN